MTIKTSASCTGKVYGCTGKAEHVTRCLQKDCVAAYGAAGRVMGNLCLKCVTKVVCKYCNADKTANN